MFKRGALLIAMISMLALMLAASGCTTTSPAATVPASATPAPTLAPGTYKITTEGKNVKIEGNGVVKTETFKLPENWYAVKEAYGGAEQTGHMNYFEYSLMNAANKQAYGSMQQSVGTWVGYAGIHYPETMENGTTDTFYVQTADPTAGLWTIEYIAPPNAADTAPKAYSGTGSAFVGPVKLPARMGRAEINYTGQGDFGVSFYQQDVNYDQYPSFFIDLPEANTDNIRDGKSVSPFNTTVDIDNHDPDLMLLLAVNAPQGGSWNITVSPA